MNTDTPRDSEGYLFQPEDWNETLASEMAKEEAKQLVFELFPYGYVKQACKIAGMKKPRAWSTG